MIDHVKGVPSVRWVLSRDEIARLVRDARCGQGNAEETLLRSMRQGLISYFVNSRRFELSLAEDLAQRTLMVLHRAIHRGANGVRPEDALGYVWTVAKRLANQTWRDPHRRRAAEAISLTSSELAETSSELADPQTDPSDLVARRDLLERVLAAGKTHLSPESLHIVARHAIGWSLADIALELGCSGDSVRQRHSRAIRTLRTVFAEHAHM